MTTVALVFFGAAIGLAMQNQWDMAAAFLFASIVIAIIKWIRNRK